VILGLRRPGRVVVVDEAFMDTIPGEPQSLTGHAARGLLVARSLTKQWAIPGVRAGYVVGDGATVAALRGLQTPWSVSTAAVAAMVACAGPAAAAESAHRARTIAAWRAHLVAGLDRLGVPHVPSSTSFVLARPGDDVHAALRARGIAVRRADTFPGLGPDWVRIAVRPPATTDRLLTALHDLSRGER